jgi:DedD protein
VKTLLDDEEEGKASEITLSTASLLGVFFGLVLVCGVFFGFGYSMGRGTGLGTHAAAPAEPVEPTVAESAPPPSLAPAEQQDDVQPPAKAARPVAKPEVAAAADKDETAPPPAPVTRVAVSKPPAGQPAAAELPSTPVAAPAPGQPMVQIAAVARQEDADVLVGALRQRGYGVVVRNEPQDKLLHVQVGPFADRVQATAMKQKLLSDGYNAIIKQ